MKKKTKKACKILSIFLALLIVIQILPLQVLAENIAELLSNHEATNTSVDESNDVSILYEIEEKRDEHTKVYKKSDGTYTAVKTVEPLHYLNDGVWEEINNSMSLNGNLYTNLDNLFNVELPKTIDSNENLTVEKDGYTLSFSIDDIEESSAVVENDIVVSDTNIAIADDAIAQTQSSVTYNNVAEDTDLQYIVTPNSIKENIIVSNQESIKDTYTFTFETNGLDTEKLDDGSVVFKDENSEIKFRIPRPVMTDLNYAFSYDINVVLIKNTNGTITLEYSPSSEWTNSSDRVYPITIDPAITVIDEESDFIEDTVVGYNSDNPEVANQNGADTVLTALTNMLTQENSNGTTTIMDSEIYTKIDTEFFKNLGNDIVFTEVQYIAAGMTTHNGKILAREITEDWDVNTVTYNTKPEISSQIIDYYSSPLQAGEEYDNFVYIHFNITGIFNEWFNGKTNNGFAMTATENTTAFIVINGSSQNTAIVLDYVDMSGYNENYSYHTQTAGRAGTGYVNDFTQQLSVIRDDINIADNNFPVTIGMIYDSATYGKIKSLNYNNLLAYGNNWTPNYLRAYLVSNENNFTYYTETGSTIDFVRSIDDEGNITFSELFSNIYGNHGYELEYHPASDEYDAYYTVNRPDGYIEKFNNDGLLTSVTKLVYTNQLEDNSSEQSTPICTEQSLTVKYDDSYRIDYITDYSGRVYNYVYFDDIDETDKNLLSKITYYTSNNDDTAPLEITYTYDENNNLIKVTFPDKKSVEYVYENGNMKSMTNIDNYRITYGYEENVCINDIGEEAIEYTDKVANVVEQAKNGTTYVNGNSISYERLNSKQVKLTDAADDYEIYNFGAFGNLLYTIDNNGNYVMHEDVDSTDETHFASVSDYREFSSNLLSNPSFEETDSDDGSPKDWVVTKISSNQTNESSATSSDEEPALFGTNVLKLSCNDNESISVKQSVSVLEGGEYTFSAYIVTTEETSQPLTLNLYSNNTPQSDIATTSITTTNGKWERIWVTFNAPVDTEELTVELSTTNDGTFYVDGVQLEHSSSSSLYNYVQNGGFNNGLDNWTTTTNLNLEESNINEKTVNAIRLSGGADIETAISQTVSIDGKKNDVIRVGGWFKGFYTNSSTNNVWLENIIEESEDPKICNFTEDRKAYIEVKCVNTNTNYTQTIEIPFNENIGGWQFVAREFSLDRIYDQATITVYYSKNLNSALFSNVELTKTKVRTTSVEDGEIQCPCANCAVINCSCNCTRELYCYCSQCLESTNTHNRQDSFGEIALGNNYDEIAVVQLLTQRIGDNVTSNFNLSNGLLKDFYDAVENHSTYTYDSYEVLKEIYNNDDGNKEILVLYEYDNDKLEFIIRNDFAYGFSYDCWGQLVSISVGETIINENNKREYINGRAIHIVSYEYDEDEYRDRIISLTYHNDDKQEYDKSESVSIDFGYNNQTGDIDNIFVNGCDRADILNVEVNDIYTAEADVNNNLIETIDGATFETELIKLSAVSGIYYETKSVTANNQNSIGTGIELDINGRYLTTNAVIGNINDLNTGNKQRFIRNSYQYIDSATSNQKIKYKSTICYDSIVNEDPSWSSKYLSEYEYDDNNNVITESIYNYIDSDQKQLISYTNYEYTKLNQLARVNKLINNSPEDKKSVTYVYTYDNAGNVTSKTQYPYTTSEEITSKPNSVINYQYNEDNGVWKDRLTSTIDADETVTIMEYDNIGNPLTIGNNHFTWSGRLLQTYENKDTGKFIEYEYDKNGLCNKKIVYENNIIIETHDYIWSEGRLVSQIYTDSASAKYVIKYVYDLYNSPYGFIFCYSDIQENGESKNIEERYLFRRNMKNDIIAIVNESGNDIINYEYDVWGATESFINNSNDDNVLKNIEGSLVLRYRGYCYDNHTDLYYIQGRYYSPELCRFINADNTSNLGSTGTALSYNLYTYCENNPVMYMVDNKDTKFSNTINSNYIYNKRISQNLSGYIDDQKNGIASKLRYGINTISPVGCGCVATYNALLMLGNPSEICDIIREFETSKLLYYGLYGTHVGNIGKFLATEGYDVTITFANSDNVDDNIAAFDAVAQDENVKANILLFRNYSVSHFIAIKYDSNISDYINFNATIYDTSTKAKGSIKKFIPKNCEPMALISISSK